MLKALKRFLPAVSTAGSPSYKAYFTLVEQARNPWFYQEQGVPDTLDGRFDVIVLHLFLLIHRLRKESPGTASNFIRDLSEMFFADMDRSLREMGVGDTGISHRVKKMVQAFYGRLHAYEETLHDPAGFGESIRRNLYRDADVSDAQISAIGEYVLRNAVALQKQPVDKLLRGEVSFS